VGIPEKEAAVLLDGMLEFLKATLQKGEPIAISNFGKFTVRSKAPRKARNPRTGEDVMILAHRVVTFYASPSLKHEVNFVHRETRSRVTNE
jgi:integration host factor subunit alpha